MIETEQFFRDRIINAVVEKKGFALAYSWDDYQKNIAIHDPKDNILYVESENITAILKQLELDTRFTLSQLRTVLEPFLEGNSKEKWVKNHNSRVRHYFWRFRADVLGIKLPENVLDTHIPSTNPIANGGEH
jgi:YD repeat-containing protein